MKKFTRILSVVVLGFSLTYCSKKSNDPTPATTTTPTTNSTSDGFTWSEDGGAVITADSAFWTSGSWGAGVRAYKGGYANFFELNLDNANTGNHTLSTSSAFLKGNDTYAIASGSLAISANTNDKLSGNFEAKVSGGMIKTVKGDFSNLKKK